MFRQASRSQTRLRMTLDGPAGSGKTYTALRFAHALAQFRQSQGGSGKIAVIDTERGSAAKYVGEAPDGIIWAFDTATMATFGPDRYTDLIQMAGQTGYSVLVIDSLSHAWEGVGGALEIKDQVGGTNSYVAWRQVTPMHNRMIDAILQSPLDVITTMRSRMEYVQNVDDKGKVIGIRRVGMAPVQRPGMEYEFDIVCDVDWSHILSVSKSRCSAVDGLKVQKPGPEFMRPVMAWLSSTTTVPPAQPDVYAPTQTAVPAAAAPAVLTLNDLLERYSAEAILVANQGQIPGTDAEVAAVAAKLEAA